MPAWALSRGLVLALAFVVVLGAEVHASSVMTHGPRERPWVALTFDDGWSVSRCARIVRTLRAKHAPATFFINGAIIDRDPAQWRKLLDGFAVANHTLSHKDLTSLEAANLSWQIAANERVIERALERPMLRLLRPSYGAYDAEVVRIAAALGYHTILWDTDSGDGRSGATTRSIIEDGGRGTNGAIVLLHCGPATTPAAVGPLIERYRSRGFRLVDLGEMLDLEPPPTACRVTDVDQDETTTRLQRAVRRAAAGDRLTIQGTCLGAISVRKPLELVGIGSETSGTPTLDGIGRGPVVTVKTGVTVTIRGLAIQGGERGILNRGDLTLHDVVVHRNGPALDGAGVYNAKGGTLSVLGVSSIRDNIASGAAAGVLNAGVLVLGDSSSILRNVVDGESYGADDVEDGADPPPASSPSLDGNPPGGAGGGVMDLGIMLGAVCAPAVHANVRGNSPDDCRSAAPASLMAIPERWALVALALTKLAEPVRGD